jgi:multidrug efflux pump
MHEALIDGAISRSRMVLVILIMALFAGAATYLSLPKEADPDIPIPFVGVTIPLQGISPEDAERLLVRPAETQLQSIEGLKELSGFAAEGAGQLVLEFDVSFDQDQALLDVREKIDMARREFPDEAKEPVITEVNANLFPILTVNLYGDIPERALYRIADTLQEDLEALPGVLEANILGKREEVLEIVIDPAKLETYNLSYADVLRTVTNNNRLVPAGQINSSEGSFPIKVPGLIENANDAFGLPLRASGDAVITLSDVATIRRTFKDREVYARFNGEPAISISIVKRSGANIIDTVNDVRTTVADSARTWPTTLKNEATGDMSEMIRDNLGQLQSSIATAIVLVMIIVVAALGFRSAMLVGLSIPASFVLAFLLLGVFGFTINMMVMFGMVIAVGILVDGAIVVVEYADRKMAEGMDKKSAYALAAKRMFWPIVSSSATTLAAFAPFLFWNSLPGKFMSFLPITLIFVLSASLVMALIFLPVLGSIFGARPPGDVEALKRVSGEDGDPLVAPGFIGGYARFIAGMIKRPLAVTGVALIVLYSIIAWFGATPHKTEFFLDAEPEQLFVLVGAQGNLSASEEYAIVKNVEDRIVDIEGIESLSMTAGTSTGSGGFGDGLADVPTDMVGRILVDLMPYGARPDGRLIEQNIRDKVADIPGVRIEVRRLEQGPPQGKDIQIELLSDFADPLNQAAASIRDKLETTPGLIEIEDTRPLPGIEWQINVDRELAGRFGVDVTQIGAAVQLVTNGVLVGIYRPDDARDEVDIRVRLPESDRTLDALDRLTIATPQGSVPVSTFITRVPAPRIDKIDRQDGSRVITVRANVSAQGEAPAYIADIRDWLETAGIDPRVRVKFAGSDEDTADAVAFFSVASMAALFLMAVILLWQFNNIFHVLLTLSAVVLSTIGVLLGIQLALPYISVIMIGTGVVALAGIVVNNNIVLIDTYQRRQEQGRSAEEAAIMTAAQRFRPVLLTTLTTICGLLPMVWQIDVSFREGSIGHGGPASEWWVPLATAVVFGLGFSTLMTLILTPVWLTAPSKLGAWRRKMVGRILSLFGRQPVSAE